MSLRWRWALSVTAVAVLAVVSTTVVGFVTTDRELHAQVDRELETRFELAARLVPAVAPRRPFDREGPFLGRTGPGDGLDGRDLVGLDAVIQVTSGHSILVAGDPVLPLRSYDDVADPRLETVEVDGRSYRMISGRVVRRLASRSEVVQVAMPIDDIDQALGRLLGRLAVLGAALAVVAGASGWLLARRAVQPIEQLTGVTDALAAGAGTAPTLPVDAPGEVGHLAGSFARMLSSLQASRAQQQRLVADASHEFRTPLTALRTNLETLHRRGHDLTDEQRNTLIGAAVAETAELSTLAAELVDLATSADQDRDAVGEVDLGETAETVASRYRSRRAGPIVVTGPGEVVQGRSVRIERAISNLLDNAVKWSPPKTPIEVRLEGGTVTVSDRGPGIPPAELPHVFERFHRSVEARSMPGSGLGLAIVEHVVSAHGGTVFARNRPDGGAEVGFTLP